MIVADFLVMLTSFPVTPMRLAVNDSGSRFVIRSWSGDRRAQSVSTGVEVSTDDTEYSVHASNMGVSVCTFPLIDRETVR